MGFDRIIALAAAAVSSAALVFLLVKLVFRAQDDAAESAAAGSVRALLAVPAAFVLRRRSHDRELNLKLEEYEKYVTQSGGRFLDGATAAEVFVARYVFPALAIVVFSVLGVALKLPPGIVLLVVLFFAGLLFLWPESALKGMAHARTSQFVRELPLALDVMRLVTQSGGDLHAAIENVIQVAPRGPVREELSRCLGEVAIGTSLAEALNHVAARIGTSEANAVFSTLSQSLEMGTSVSDNVGSAAALIRHQARIRAQEKAQKAVVAMSFPLLLFILPGVFIVLFAPLVIQYVNR